MFEDNDVSINISITNENRLELLKNNIEDSSAFRFYLEEKRSLEAYTQATSACLTFYYSVPIQCSPAVLPSTSHVNKSEKEGKDQESIQSSTTPVPGYQLVGSKLTIRHHKREARGQPFPSRRPQDNNKQTRTKA